MTTDPPLRVVQWGTGNTGMVAPRAILASPNLELVGVWAHNPTFIGRDAADLVGLEAPTGVAVTGDPDAVIDSAPQCVCYMASDRGRHDEVIDDLCRLLAAGINVVATTLPVLELYGDRGRPQATREQLRIPDRENIQLRWFASASHSLHYERPKLVADAINQFIHQCEAQAAP